MDRFRRLFENNAKWAKSVLDQDPTFFFRSQQGQQPHFLWIGCADSRVPVESLTGATPGEIFVHRNIGNQVWSTDVNVLSVIHYAVEVLDVKHIIVAGHTECGALKAAVGPHSHGIVDLWLSDVRNVIRWHKAELEAIPEGRPRMDRLAELNVMQQVGILSRTPIILDNWERGQRPILHGIVYDVATGLLRSVVEGVDSVDKAEQLLPTH